MFYKFDDQDIYGIDPKGFLPPYDVCGEVEEQVLRAKYFRLSNKSNHPLKIRNKGLLYGGRQIDR
jgi:hypothetical protein